MNWKFLFKLLIFSMILLYSNPSFLCSYFGNGLDIRNFYIKISKYAWCFFYMMLNLGMWCYKQEKESMYYLSSVLVIRIFCIFREPNLDSFGLIELINVGNYLGLLVYNGTTFLRNKKYYFETLICICFLQLWK